MLNSWRSSYYWLTVAVLGMSFAGLAIRLINGAQFVLIWMTALAGIGTRSVIQHRNDTKPCPQP
jgi:hypothetical protein